MKSACSNLPSKAAIRERTTPAFMNTARMYCIKVLFFLMLGLASLTATSQRVLVIYDVLGANTSNLVTAMQNAGLTVTLSSVPEFQWNGTNPALTNFDCVVHLDGASYGTPMPLAGQTALMNFVNSGKGYVDSEWLAYEILQH
ncbi:MAG TPA: hypothetical protein PLC48_15150, partial [Ferruginibacter sp.]|nr:hypothetical protein [Ferruginibacter sp.]